MAELKSDVRSSACQVENFCHFKLVTYKYYQGICFLCFLNLKNIDRLRPYWLGCPTITKFWSWIYCFSP